MSNNSIIHKNLLQLTAIVLGAVILTIVTQRSFNSIATVTDEFLNNIINSKSLTERTSTEQPKTNN